MDDIRNTQQNKSNIEQALDEALQSLMAGEQLDKVVARYPEMSDELRPMLLAAYRLHSAPQPALAPSSLAAIMERAQAQAAIDRQRKGVVLAAPLVIPAVGADEEEVVSSAHRLNGHTPGKSVTAAPGTAATGSFAERLRGWLGGGSPAYRTAATVTFALVLLFSIVALTGILANKNKPVGPNVPATAFSVQGVIQSIDGNTWVVDGASIYLDNKTIVTGNPAVGATAQIEGRIEIGEKHVAENITISATVAASATTSVTTPATNTSIPRATINAIMPTSQSTALSVIITVTTTPKTVATTTAITRTTSVASTSTEIASSATNTQPPFLPPATSRPQSTGSAIAGPNNPTVIGTSVPASTSTSTAEIVLPTGTRLLTSTPTAPIEPTNTLQPTFTPLPTQAPTYTPTQRSTEIPTPVPTSEPTGTPTPEPTSVPMPTDPPRPTRVPTTTMTAVIPTDTAEPTQTATYTPVVEPTQTRVPLPTRTAQEPPTHQPTATQGPPPPPTEQPTWTPRPQETETPRPTETPRLTETPRPTRTEDHGTQVPEPTHGGHGGHETETPHP